MLYATVPISRSPVSWSISKEPVSTPGDSISVYPAPTIDKVVKEKIAEYTRRLAKALHVKGLINIQFIAIGEEVYVIEVNPALPVPYLISVR